MIIKLVATIWYIILIIMWTFMATYFQDISKDNRINAYSANLEAFL